MKQGALILIIDDEIQIRRFIRMSLTASGYQVIESETAADGLRELVSSRPDAVLLDLGLPDMDGSEVLSKIREWSSIPVIILTVRDSEKEKVALLDHGADDYLTKPFSIEELKARIRVVLRHQIKNSEPTYSGGGLKIDFSKRIVYKDKKEVKLTPTEYSILSLLAKNAGKVITQTFLAKELWGPNAPEEINHLRIFIMQLRRKIEKEPSDPILLVTEPGIGYRLNGGDKD